MVLLFVFVVPLWGLVVLVYPCGASTASWGTLVYRGGTRNRLVYKSVLVICLKEIIDNCLT